ncbi:MAG: DUF5131 family protein, partial [Xanthomonadales bacterium]|nr:DUF5131 family protein [Xanthomonadales bacterium]
MSEKTGIAWTDHTFNPWWGCTKVSPACANCYAETWDARFNGGHWGSEAPRRFFGDKHWAAPLKWNMDAVEAGERRRVFCASMADIFEQREDLVDERFRWIRMVHNTPGLDWLALTKRIKNVEDSVPPDWRHSWPANVWLGCTVEDQERANERVPALKILKEAFSIPVTFISAEPMFEPITLPWVPDWVIAGGESGA